MAAALLHRCQHCGYEMDVGTSLEIFERDPHCGRCGLSASEGDQKMQEELATLVTQRLNLQSTANYEAQPPTPPQRESESQITYITQHYHHSAHQATQTPPEETRPVTEILAAHGVDAGALFASQINLFEQAPPEQQVRLIQLWSVAPPVYGHQAVARDILNWPQTSMRQEEEAAQARYMMKQAELGNNSPELRNHAEPYILRGYETTDASNEPANACFTGRPAEYNRALDPAYQSKEWWLHESQPIEQPNGPTQPMRQYADQDEEMS